MRRGRQCRGQGQVFVKLSAKPNSNSSVWESLSKTGAAGPAGWNRRRRCARRPASLASTLHTAVDAHTHIRTQSTRLQGKKLRHCKIVNAYDPTIAPILKGCPAQFGRKPGIVSEPATGFSLPTWCPRAIRDPSYVLPLLDKVAAATQRVRTRHVYSVAGENCSAA